MKTVKEASLFDSSKSLDDEQLRELYEVFENIKVDGVIKLSELQKCLEILGVKLPQYEVRNIINEHYSNKGANGSISINEFSHLYFKLKSKNDPHFRSNVHKASNVQILEGTSEASQAIGIFHSVRNEEQVAFADWINSNLSLDQDLKHVLPIQKSGEDLYDKVVDGLILCKLINLAVPETIDERAVNKKHLNAYTRLENLILVVNSARAIGCNIVNIDADDISKAKKHLILGLLWQIIRIGLFNQIDLIHVPGLIRLLHDGETFSDLQRLSPEQILIRWVNYHLQQAGVSRRLSNFTHDIQDSEIYSHLLKQIAPAEYGITLDALKISGENVKRAECMLKEANKLKCRAFVTAHDVVNGVYKLNLAFVANLFNSWPALKPPDGPQEIAELEAIQEETREERTYRNWMNSMAVDPYVNWLYSDLANGLIICQLYDIIKPKIIDWKKVATKFDKFRSMMQHIENCNYAVDIGRQLRFSLVGIQGKDIYDGNPTLTLALIWQLMRAYTLTILAECTSRSSNKQALLASDKDIIDWVNQKLKSKNSKDLTVTSFQDPRLSDAKVVLDLIDCIRPGSFDYGLIKHGNSYQDKLVNAKYAITTARKIGAKVYALPEDIVEVKPKMVMTVFACLMARDFSPVCTTIMNDDVDVRDGNSGSKQLASAVENGAAKSQPPPPPERTFRIPPEELAKIRNGSSRGDLFVEEHQALVNYETPISSIEHRQDASDHGAGGDGHVEISSIKMSTANLPNNNKVMTTKEGEDYDESDWN